MANDSFDINVSGLGSAKGGKLDTSEIQKSIDKVASELKKLDTSNFQKNLRDLAQDIQKASTSATNFIASMQKNEAQISASLKEGLSSQTSPNGDILKTLDVKDTDKKSVMAGTVSTPEKLANSIGSLSDSIEKLASSFKDGFKSKDTPAEEKSKQNKEELDLVSGAKKLLAAVGIGSIIKQISENEILAPAKATGMLINSNVVSNPRQAGNELLSAYQNRLTSNMGVITGATGAAAGAAIGSIVPGVGTLIGAGVGYAGGSILGNAVGEKKMATELPTLQRALQSDYYANNSKQSLSYTQFAQTQYGPKGFASAEAFQDPYFESKAELGKSFSRFAGGDLTAQSTSGILKSLTAQGATSPQELNITGNLLGQIARYTGKSSLDIEKVYKAVEKTGMNPNEGLQKTLSLLQSGLSVKETEEIMGNTSQKTEAFSAAQSSYYNSSPFQQYSAQLVGKAVGIDVEKLEKGDKGEATKIHKITEESNAELRSGKLGPASIKLQQLMAVGIGRELGDTGRIDLKSSGKEGDFLSPSRTQQQLIQTTQEAITKGAKGRGPEEIVGKALEEIGKSTETFGGLKEAAKSLTDSFIEATKSVGDYLTELSGKDNRFNPMNPAKQVVTKSAGGR